MDEDYFEKLGALNEPMAFLRLLHYPGKLEVSNEETYGASAHSDYGTITLLASDGVPGLQLQKQPKRRAAAQIEGISSKAKPKKKHAISKRIKLTNAHLLELFKNLNGN